MLLVDRDMDPSQTLAAETLVDGQLRQLLTKWHAILSRISSELEDEKDIEHKQSIIEYLNGLLNTWIRSVFKGIVCHRDGM